MRPLNDRTPSSLRGPSSPSIAAYATNTNTSDPNWGVKARPVGLGSKATLGGVGVAGGGGGNAALGGNQSLGLGQGSMQTTPSSPSPVPWGNAPTAPSLTVTASPSPEMQSSIEAWKKRMEELKAEGTNPDPNLQAQIDMYKERMGKDNTQRAMDKASSAIRSQAAGAGEMADAAGSQRGTGPGTGAAGIGDTAQMAMAKSASDIQLGREQQLDNLLLGGQGIMSSPSQRSLAYQGLQNSAYATNPYAQTAELGLKQQGLGIEAYLGQLNAQNQAAQTQAQLYGSPYQWYQSLLSGMGGMF